MPSMDQDIMENDFRLLHFYISRKNKLSFYTDDDDDILFHVLIFPFQSGINAVESHGSIFGSNFQCKFTLKQYYF